MARYLITYDDGTDQTLTVDRIEYDGEQYKALTGNELIAYIRPLDVRSIVCTSDEPIRYPHADGDLTILGPEIFVSSDRKVICWKGENYIPQSTAKAVND